MKKLLLTAQAHLHWFKTVYGISRNLNQSRFQALKSTLKMRWRFYKDGQPIVRIED